MAPLQRICKMLEKEQKDRCERNSRYLELMLAVNGDSALISQPSPPQRQHPTTTLVQVDYIWPQKLDCVEFHVALLVSDGESRHVAIIPRKLFQESANSLDLTLKRPRLARLHVCDIAHIEPRGLHPEFKSFVGSDPVLVLSELRFLGFAVNIFPRVSGPKPPNVYPFDTRWTISRPRTTLTPPFPSVTMSMVSPSSLVFPATPPTREEYKNTLPASCHNTQSVANVADNTLPRQHVGFKRKVIDTALDFQRPEARTSRRRRLNQYRTTGFFSETDIDIQFFQQ